MTYTLYHEQFWRKILALNFFSFFILFSVHSFSQTDLYPSSLIGVQSRVICNKPEAPISVAIRKKDNNAADFWASPLKVTVSVSGTKTATLSGQISSGVAYSSSDSFLITVNSDPAFTLDKVGEYIFKVKISFADDINTSNDELTIVQQIKPPFTIPFFEDINSDNTNEWRFDEHPTYQCENTSVIISKGDNKFVRTYQGDCRYAFFTLPSIGKVREGDVLSFDYRILNNNLLRGTLEPAFSGYTQISISATTDCGKTFELIGNILATDHIPNDEFVTKTFSLSQFVGQDIKIRVVTYSVTGDFSTRIFFEFDNFRIDKGIPQDMGVIRRENLNFECDNTNQNLKVKVKNFGIQAVNFATTPVVVTAQITGGTTATLTKIISKGSLAPEGVMDVALDGTFNMSALDKVYDIAFFTTMPNDGFRQNDTLKASIRSPKRANPVARPLPFVENADGAAPTGWFPSSFANPSHWIISQGTGNGGNSLSKPMSNTLALVSPSIGAIRANDRFSVDLKISKIANPNEVALVDWGNVTISITSDCGATYETVLTIDSNQLKTGTWTTFAAPLSNFVSQNIKIVINNRESIFNVYRIDLDNFAVNTSPSVDLGLESMVSPETNCQNNQQSVSIKIKNNSGFTHNFSTNPATISAQISGAANTTLSKALNAGSLTSGETLDVILDGTFNMATIGQYSIKSSIITVNDASRANDTLLTQKRTVRQATTIPFRENFDNSSIYPQGWIDGEWKLQNSTEGSSGKYISVDVKKNSNGKTELYLPVMNFVREDDYWTFNYQVKHDGYNNIDAIIKFEASSDCGKSFKLLHTIGGEIPRMGWKEMRLPLSIFKGDPVVLRVRTENNTNYYNWQLSLDDINVDIIKPTDIVCDTVWLKDYASSCGNSERQALVSVTNRGAKLIDFSKTPMTLTVKLAGQNNQTVTKKINAGILNVFEQNTFLIDDYINTSIHGDYTIQAISSTIGDVTIKNDSSKIHKFSVTKPYASPPYYESFDTVGLPKNWILDRWEIRGNEGQDSKFARSDFFAETPLTSPLIGVIKTGDRLYFDYYVYISDTTQPVDGHLTVEITTNCGFTFKTLVDISSVNTSWLTKSISLDQFAGGNIIVRFIPYHKNTNYFISIDNFRIAPSTPLDISTVALISPYIECGYEKHDVILQMRNSGSSTIKFNQNPLTLKVLVSGPINEFFSKTITNGELGVDSVINVKFDRQINTLNAGTYTYQVIAQMVGDGIKMNDTLPLITKKITRPYPVPFKENFDNLTSLSSEWHSEGWVVEKNNFEDTNKYLHTTLWNGNYIDLPKLGLIRPNDVLDFDYSFETLPPGITNPLGKVEVLVSDDCGKTFKSNFSFEYDAFVHGTGWFHGHASLNDYVGKAIVIRLKFVSEERRKFYLDNISVNNVSPLDVESTELFYNTNPTSCPAGSTWVGAVSNIGNIDIDMSITPLTITATFSGAKDTVITQTINEGILKARRFLRLYYDFDMSKEGIYASNLLISLAGGDINKSNDTLKGRIDTRGEVLPYLEDFNITNKYFFLTINMSHGVYESVGVNGTGGLIMDITDNGGFKTYLNTPKMAGIRENDVLTFDMRVTDFEDKPITNWGKIIAKAAISCSEDYKDIATIDTTGLGLGYWVKRTVSLRDFVGQNIIVQLETVIDPNYEKFKFWIDNIKIDKGDNINSNAPINDLCSNATNLNTLSQQGTTEAATPSVLIASTCATTGDNDIWYKITSPTNNVGVANTNIILNNIANGAVVNYAIYKGSCNTLQQVDSIGLCGKTSTEKFLTVNNMEQGQTYFLRLSASNINQAGKFFVRIDNSMPFSTLNIADNTTNNVCKPLSIIQIGADNNNVWVPVMDGNNIVAQIKCNGNNLGKVLVDYFINKSGAIRKISNVPYLDRNVGFKPDMQPSSPVSVRIYVTDAEWKALKAADPSVKDTAFSVTRVPDQTCTNSFTATAASQITNATLNSFNGGYYIQFNTAQFSQFFISNNKSVLRINTSINEILDHQLKVYPVPTDGLLNIDIQTEKANEINIQVLDIFGRVVYEQRKNKIAIGDNHFALNLDSLIGGSYILIISDKNGQKIRKISR
jgi:hypothetical protein